MIPIPPDPIRINDEEFKFDSLPNEAQSCVQHLVDIDEQLNQLKFKMDQLQVGRAAFIVRLNQVMQENSNALRESTTHEGIQPKSADA